jgi:hypothetical protein
MNSNWHIRVQFGDPRGGDISTRLADVLLPEEELGGKIGDGDGSGVIEGEGFNSGEGNVFGCERLRLGKFQWSFWRRGHSPISTPSPLRPTTRTLEEPIRFMASWPST